MSQMALSFTSVSVAGDPGVNDGWTFSLSTSITVTALGAYQVPGDSPAQVGIWNSSGTLLASTTVTASDPSTGGFNFASIGATTLPAGSYTIGEWFAPNPGGPIGYHAVGLTTIPEVTYTGGVFQTGTSFSQPLGDAFGGGLDPGYFGPNFEVACLLTGTRVLTPAGEVPVETLRPGDLVTTVSGAHRAIRWIGFGCMLVTPVNRHRATPVVVRRHAIADDVPCRDLYITRGHALYLDGVLIPVEELINHRSIAWVEEAQAIEYYHIELDSHDVIWGDGAAVETYREDANEAAYLNAETRPETPPMPPYAPVLHEDPRVKRIWRTLSDRAGRPDLAFTEDPDLHLRADGVRLTAEAVVGRLVWRFRLNGPVADLRIVSRSAIPSMIGLEQDQRRLGVALRKILLRNHGVITIVDLEEKQLQAGFHGAEPTQRHRWTDGEAVLPRQLLAACGAGTVIELHVTCLPRYPLAVRPEEPAYAAA
jgi:hypothetical protein